MAGEKMELRHRNGFVWSTGPARFFFGVMLRRWKKTDACSWLFGAMLCLSCCGRSWCVASRTT